MCRDILFKGGNLKVRWKINKKNTLGTDVQQFIGPLKAAQSSVSDDDAVEMLHESLINVGHGDRDRLMKDLRNKYKSLAVNV
jgi:hypothetical protein